MATDSNKDGRQARLIAKTAHGLEETLAGELADLGAHKVKTMSRSVEFYGDKQLLYAANLWSRTAIRILKPIATFRADDEKVLYAKALKIDWRQYLALNQTFAIDVVINGTKFGNSLFVAQKTKDAIADYFRNKTGQRPSVDLKTPDLRINLFIHHNECTLALDASGDPLFKRGYRTKTGKAPLNEVLAAGIVLQSGWDRSSPFVDAMCGSGTLVIEAALWARNIAPGLRRKRFGFMNWPDFDRNLWASIREQAVKSKIPRLGFAMVGSDSDGWQVKEAADNAHRAGIGSDVVFKRSTMADLSPPAPGVLIINPPYGERMPVADINDCYHAIGDALKKNFADYDAFVFTGNLAAAKHIGLRTSQRITMYNGPIECRLLKFEMYQGSRKQKPK